MEELFAEPDPTRAERAMTAMLGMGRLDIAALRRAGGRRPNASSMMTAVEDDSGLHYSGSRPRRASS
jgi:hypothetical protein